MPYPSALDQQGLYRWARRVVAHLAFRRAEINALNVFPVPDSDTGTNMAHTMEAAVREADQGGNIAAALSRGAVKGARGNSGVVLSQVLRSISDSSPDSTIDAGVVAKSLSLAVELVTSAIATPVEGTVLTVLREAAQAATAELNHEVSTLHSTVSAAVIAARDSLAQTPSQLPALRAAGVVDAGGAGLVIFLECLLAEIEGHSLQEGYQQQPDMCARHSELAAQELEVMFYFYGDLEGLEKVLGSLGNSLAIARTNEHQARVHIHTAAAGEVIEEAYALGKVSDLQLEILPAPDTHADAMGSENKGGHLYAEAPEGPLSRLFSAAGATTFAPNTPLAGLRDGDIVVARNHPKTFREELNARWVLTRSFVASLAALAVYEQDNPDAASLATSMQDAADSMRVACMETDSTEAIFNHCQSLLARGGEQVTVLSPHNIDSTAWAKRLGVDVMVLEVPGLTTEIGVE